MLFRHSGIYILAKLIPGVMAFAALSFYTHLLSPAEYGIYTLIFTGSVFLHNVIFNWLSTGTLRYWSNKEFENSEFINTLSTTYIKIASVMFVIALIAITFYWGQQQAIWISSAFLFLMALALFTITQILYSAKIEPVKYAQLTISYSVLALLFGTLLSYLGYGAPGVVFGIAIGTFIPALLVFKRTWLPYKKQLYNKVLIKRLIVYGLPLAAVALIEEIIKVSDRFMLAGLIDKAEAGLYAVGYDLSGNSILMLMSAINIASYPVIIKLLDTEGKEVAISYFRNYVILLMGVSIPAVVGLNLVGPNLVHLLIDTDFQAAVIFLLPWVTVSVFLLGIQVFYFDLAFQLGHKTIVSVKIAVVIAIINISLNLWLIPKLGMQGAAIATIASFGSGSMLSALLGRKYFSLPFPVLDISKIVLATVIMCACLWFIKDLRGWGSLVLQLVVGLLSFLIVIFSFNILNVRSQVLEFIR